MSLFERFRQPPSFVLTQALFLRLLGLVYLAAFASLWPQILGLLGDHGITPAAESLSAIHNAFGAKGYFYLPTLFWLNSSNLALSSACVIGCVASFALLCGLFTRVSAALCFVLYLSLTTVGQPFTGFQWDALLLECGFLALFAGASWLVWAYRFLLFRLILESGIVKLSSHDVNWRNLHALRFHFLTQPLPTPLAYYAFQAPGWLLDGVTLLVLAIELLAPFLLFFPASGRRIAGCSFIALQLGILATGNYAFFNLLTLSLCLWCFEDRTYAPLQGVLERTYPRFAPLPLSLARIANPLLLVLMVAGAIQLGAAVLPVSRSLVRTLLFPIEPFEIVNSYGLFAVMTRSRPEIVLEGSNDQQHWSEFSFRYKPGDLRRPLPMVAPYQPRLDWQMWFAALETYQQNPWIASLLFRLMQNEPSVKALLNPPPFSSPPRYMRALLYDYTFSTPAERARTGAVWNRRYLGTWLSTVSLADKNQPKPQ